MAHKSLYSTVEIYVFRAVRFWLVFCPFDPDPWIRIFFKAPDPYPGSQNVADPKTFLNRISQLLSFFLRDRSPFSKCTKNHDLLL